MCKALFSFCRWLGAVALATLPVSAPAFETEVVVHLRKGADVGKLGDAVAGWARIEAREGRTDRYRLVLKDGWSLARAQQRLANRPWVVEVSAPDYIDVLSLRSVRREISRLRALEPGSGERDKRLGFLEAYEYFVEERANPHDSIDWSAYERAARHRDAMLEAEGRTLTPNRSDLLAPTIAKWEFFGPRNLRSPGTTYFGPSPVAGRVNGLAYDPLNPDRIYAASSGGGLWRSDDAGGTWRSLSDRWEFLQTSAVAVHPADPQIVLVGTGDFPGSGGYGMGVMRSTDGGESWTNTGRNLFGNQAVSKIVIDPDVPSNVLLTTGRGRDSWGRVYRSTDTGLTWSVSNGNWARWSGLAVGAPDAGNVRNYYAVGGGQNRDVWRSRNRGASWTKLTPPIGTNVNVLEVAASSVFPNVVYLLSPTERKVFKSVDAGATWSDVTAGFPDGNNNYNWSQGWYDFHITCSYRETPGGPVDVVYVGLIDIVQSRDGGATWQTVGGPTYSNSAKTHNDQHSMAIHPTNPNMALVGNDGGVYAFTYNPANNTYTHTPLSRHLGITEFYKAAFHPTNKSRALGGTQDNATPHLNGDEHTWRNVIGGDGGYPAINPQNANIQFGCTQNLNIYRTGNNWGSFANISFSKTGESVAFIAPLVMDMSNPRYVYAGTNYLRRWDDQTLAWSGRLGEQALTGGNLRAIAVAPSDSNRLYTGGSDGQVWMSLNGGSSWQRIDTGSPGLPNRVVTAISVHPNNPNDVILTVSGTGTDHAFRCADTTAATRVWSSISGAGATGLPDIPANTIERSFDHPSTEFWVGTDIGVFMTTNGGQSWANATAPLGLPNVRVNHLVAVPGTRFLNAATYGRGMWRIPLPAPILTFVTLSAMPGRGEAEAVVVLGLDRPAPEAGLRLELSTDRPDLLAVPDFVTIMGGETTAELRLTLAPVRTAEVATLRVRLGDEVRTLEIPLGR